MTTTEEVTGLSYMAKHRECHTDRVQVYGNYSSYYISLVHNNIMYYASSSEEGTTTLSMTKSISSGGIIATDN